MKSFIKDIAQIAKILVVAVVLTMGVGYVSAAWSNPTATPPDGNTPAPINVGASTQHKEGRLNLGSTDFVSYFPGSKFFVGGEAVIAGNLVGLGNVQFLSGSPAVGKVLASTNIQGHARWEWVEDLFGCRDGDCTGDINIDNNTTNNSGNINVSAGVSKIIPGTNVTISSTGTTPGTGDVTINANIGGGSGHIPRVKFCTNNQSRSGVFGTNSGTDPDCQSAARHTKNDKWRALSCLSSSSSISTFSGSVINYATWAHYNGQWVATSEYYGGDGVSQMGFHRICDDGSLMIISTGK